MQKPADLAQLIQSCEIWLRDMEERPQISDEDVQVILRAVLHTLRDRLPPEDSQHLSAHLPVLVRTIYVDGWSPAKTARPADSEEFYERMRERLAGACADIEDRNLSRYVFCLLNHYIPPHQAERVRRHLPQDLQAQWPDSMPQA